MRLTDSLPGPFSPCYLTDNHDDGETTWEKPEALMTESEKFNKEAEAEMPEWAKVYDPESTMYYCPSSVEHRVDVCCACCAMSVS